MAPSWSLELEECPINAVGMRPIKASSRVNASPVKDLTPPNSAVVTTAAMMVTASQALPVSMSVMK